MPGDGSDRYIPPEFWLMHSKVPEFKSAWEALKAGTSPGQLPGR